MKNPTRKSTALISLVLVPMNLMGLGFTAGGCDSRDDNASSGSFAEATPPPPSSADDADQAEVIDFDARDPEDPFTLDPVPYHGGEPPATRPTTQPLAASSFASQAPYHSGSYTHYRSGGGFFFVPIPYRSGYRPPYRPGFVSPHYPSGYRPSYTSPRPGYTPGRSGYVPGRSGYSPSSPSRSSPSHSSGVTRGGFGSSGKASSSSSGS